MEKQVMNTNYRNVEDTDDEAAAIQVLTACGSSTLEMVLNAAIQLNVFEIIAKAGDGAHISTSDVVSQLPTHSTDQETVRILDCMFRFLVAHSFLTCSASHLPNGEIERRYGLAPASKFYVGDESGVSLAQYHRLCCNGDMTELGFGLKDAILEGGGSGTLFERVKGKPYYEYKKSSDPESHKFFNISMGAHSVIVMKKVLKIYHGFEGLSSIVNVGGGTGVTLDMIISKYPYIHGINFDLPEVIQTAPSYNGIEHIGGDMFLEVPKGNAILLKFILHNWSDDQCLKLLKNCYKSLPNKGKAIILDYILPEIPQSDGYSKLASQADFIMQTMFGGKERTKREFEEITIKAGFGEFKVVCCAYGLWIMELIK